MRLIPLILSVVLFPAAGAFAGGLTQSNNPELSPALLRQEAYVWQRAWTDSLRTALQTDGKELQGTIVLAAQVDWRDNSPNTRHVAVDYSCLARLDRPVGLALRISSYRGPFSQTNRTAQFLCGLSRETLASAVTAGLSPTELQIDFDCSVSKLSGYRLWLAALRDAIRPVPLTFTALPAWLGSPEFRALTREANGYVLQVHSLQRDSNVAPGWHLCDPSAAQIAVQRASAFGRPFRVALPTYAYLVAEDADGRLLGVSAEDPRASWPAGAKVNEVWADPLAMAGLVRVWQKERPAEMIGITWYRFPVPEDTLNWRWSTLNAILHSRIPSERVRVESRRVEAGLVEISLLNEGELDISSRLAIIARWQGARLRAADGLRGFALARREPGFARFESPQPFRLPAGDTRVIGWLRLSEDCEVRSEVETLPK